jgi:hypothetical protein
MFGEWRSTLATKLEAFDRCYFEARQDNNAKAFNATQLNRFSVIVAYRALGVWSETPKPFPNA